MSGVAVAVAAVPLRSDSPTFHRFEQAIAAFNALDAFEQREFAEGLWRNLRAGMPIAPFDGAMQEALLWADYAQRSEHEAYLVACFKALPPRRQQDFLTWAASSRNRSAA